MICYSRPKNVEYRWITQSTRDTQSWTCLVFVDQTKSLCSKNLKLNIWIWLHPKSALLCPLLTQIGTWTPNHTVLKSSVKAILKAMTHTVFIGPNLGVVRILFFTAWSFFNKREYSGADCLDLLVMHKKTNRRKKNVHYDWFDTDKDRKKYLVKHSIKVLVQAGKDLNKDEGIELHQCTTYFEEKR